MSFISEFKEFAMKGNVVDLAIGVIVGTAFGKIVSSLVNDVIMPPIGMLMGGVNFTDLSFKLDQGGTVVVKYGSFIQTIVDFTIIAVVLFMVIKGMNKLKKPVEALPVGPTQEQLLTDIRDLLKRK